MVAYLGSANHHDHDNTNWQISLTAKESISIDKILIGERPSVNAAEEADCMDPGLWELDIINNKQIKSYSLNAAKKLASWSKISNSFVIYKMATEANNIENDLELHGNIIKLLN